MCCSVFFKKKYNIDIFTGHEVLKINPGTKEIRVKNLHTGKEFAGKYDKLIVATGATAFVPDIKGIYKEMVIKAIADKKTERIQGVQIVGYDAVDKQIDIFVVLITYGMMTSRQGMPYLSEGVPYDLPGTAVLFIFRGFNKNLIKINSFFVRNIKFKK